jgi:peptidoglycan/LPS O-acetylase OafA/YrhL
MMLLGVVRHAAMSYEVVVYEGWPYRDAQADVLVHWLIAFIRVFQLPIFFAIAGFFAAYMVQTRGIRGFLRQRWSRIGVPFLVAWPLIGMATWFVMRFVSQFGSIPSSYLYSLDDLTWARVSRYLFMHLWFLYHLMILCVVAGGVRLLAVRIPEGVRARALDLFGRLVHRGGIAVAAVIAGTILYQMQSWEIDYSGGPIPPLRLLALWGLSFAFGWLLFRRRDVLEAFKRPTWPLLAAGIGCFIPYRLFADAGCHPGPDRICTGTSEALHVGAVVFLAFSMWFMIYGLIGLFLRYMDKASSRWRYMADASYWIYIVHIPFVMLLAPLLANVLLPAILKLTLISITAVCLILLLYRYLVRPTFIGKQLNGRRYPRGVT